LAATMAGFGATAAEAVSAGTNEDFFRGGKK
jgi:hypothetical protein